MSTETQSDNFLARLGRLVLAQLGELGALAIFTFRAVVSVVSPPVAFRKVLSQTYTIGASSIFVITLVGLFAGMVLGLQGYYTLVKFGSEGLLGAAVALTLIRELGPVLTAIMIIARAGSAMAAEIGIMRISEQIDALDTMDVDPIRFLVSPKLAAAVISFPLLTALFDVVGILGGYVTGVLLLDLNAATYFTHTRPGGFGAKGVSQSTTQAVVMASVNILIWDYVLTSFLL